MNVSRGFSLAKSIRDIIVFKILNEYLDVNKADSISGIDKRNVNHGLRQRIDGKGSSIEPSSYPVYRRQYIGIRSRSRPNSLESIG